MNKALVKEELWARDLTKEQLRKIISKGEEADRTKAKEEFLKKFDSSYYNERPQKSDFLIILHDAQESEKNWAWQTALEKGFGRDKDFLIGVICWGPNLCKEKALDKFTETNPTEEDFKKILENSKWEIKDAVSQIVFQRVDISKEMLRWMSARPHVLSMKVAEKAKILLLEMEKKEEGERILKEKKELKQKTTEELLEMLLGQK